MLIDDTRSQNVSREPVSLEYQEKCVRLIQKCWRKWITRRKFEWMLNYYNLYLQQTLNKEKTKKKIVHTKKLRTIKSLPNPTTARDFEALYSVINDYDNNVKKSQNNQRIVSRIEDNKLRLAYECGRLREIMKYRNRATKIADEKKVFRLLNGACKPIIMTRLEGQIIGVNTPETDRAKQLLETFVTVKRNDLNKNERIKFLQEMKDVLAGFKKMDLTESIISLVDRELVLLNVVKLNDGQLITLRKRIEILFSCAITQTDINPALKKTPKHVKFVKCYNCRKLKSLNMFAAMSNLKKRTTCNDCRHLHRITTERINLTPYAVILKNIKVAEIKLDTESSIAYLLSVEDVYYLVQVIWRGKSAISECTDAERLRMVRWYKKADWSPSNTILLTVEEALVHSKIYELNKMYTDTFVNGIHLKHMIAKKYFKGLIDKALKCDQEMNKNKR